MKRIFGLLNVLGFVLFYSMAYATPINVANLYGTATANSTYSSPALAIDNIVSKDNYWVVNDYGTISDPNWLVIDLGSVFSVNSIDLFWQLSDGIYPGYTTNYNVYFGPDSTNWTFVDSGIFVDETSQITDSFNFGTTGQDMRYVKYEVDGGSHWSAISEIQVWSDDGSSPANPVPEPATMLLLGSGLAGLGLFKKVRRRHG